MAQQTTQFFFKVVCIGPPNVGKTSIIERYVEDNWSQDYKATIGADFRTKTINVDGQTVLLQIWDTAGQERFRALAAPFFRGANICVLVFDVSDRQTFDSIEQWRDEFLHHSYVDDKDSERFPFILLGNKSDLGAKVTAKEVRAWLKEKGYAWEYIECSAKEDTNVSQAFDRVGKLCLQDLPSTTIFPMGGDDKSSDGRRESGKVDLEKRMGMSSVSEYDDDEAEKGDGGGMCAC